MNSGRSLFTAHASLCFLLVLTAPVLWAAPVVTTSASGRYRVTGADSLQNSDYTRWAEDMTLKLERVLETAVAPEGGSVIEIVLADSREEGRAVSVLCSRQNGVLKRVMSLPRTGTVDYDLLQEGLVRLALAGIVERRRREEGLPQVIPVIPRWLSVGLARNLDREQLAGNRKIASDHGSEQATMPVSAVLGWEQLPEGWHGRQALCGLATAWIMSVHGALDRVLDRVVRQLPVSPEWLATVGLRADSVQGMEGLWMAWRQRMDRIIQEFGGLSMVLINQFKEELPLEINVPRQTPLPEVDADLGAASTSGARIDPFESLRLQPGSVTAARKTWPAVVARAASGKIERLGLAVMGNAPELVEVADRYSRFYEAVARGSWPVVQKWRLYRASSALERLERVTRGREAYLDEVERETAGKPLPGESVSGESLVPELEKSRMESYIDGAERKWEVGGRN